ncbi:AAA domain-containing protein [Nocardia sp. NPDC051030]|uniref:AAA domain-containing protein n=1 Tax=Nocardia sp. NPDC051030 TaxID=3155162 RepID=UPI0034211648
MIIGVVFGVFLGVPIKTPPLDDGRIAAQRALFCHRATQGLTPGTQGKEADIVILVLDAAADEQKARGWETAKSNLLNVAVTRARRRLVVIGDFENWATLRHFSTLAEQTEDGGLLERWSPDRNG